MAPRDAAPQVIVMGVSGVGKSTVAKSLSAVLGWTYAEGDAFHSAANVAKMASGHPLTDDDRWPWLRAIGSWMDEQIAADKPSVITCSALRRAYRDLLREGRPEVQFLHLAAGEGAGGRPDEPSRRPLHALLPPARASTTPSSRSGATSRE